jgi:4-hydroxy-2-oxoheptanedioate aldolase
MITNVVKQKLKSRKLVIGLGLSLGSTRSAEIAGNSMFDFVMVDTSHGHFDKVGATEALRLLARTGRMPFVRVHSNDFMAINGLLDAGALGMVVPMVNSPEEADKAVKATFYPPLGSRSKGSIATVVYGEEYVSNANAEIALIVMIETLDAVNRSDEILSVKGLDACLIGAADLSFTMGVEKDDRAFVDAVGRVITSTRKNGLSAGISVKNVEEALFWKDRGISFFLTSHDLALLTACIRDYDHSFEILREE